ncbi:MAG: FtsX-like permease family protein [Desulfobacterales bacterium]|nr:MAG: FtsX-like permease family protein [Desulfobacterales bacterium]
MPNGFLHRHFIVRQIARSRRQATVFLLCVALSIVTLISLNGFSASVNSSMLHDAKTLHAADIIIRSYFDLSPSVINLVEQLKDQNLILSNRVWEFYSVVRSQKSRNSLLAKLKLVQPGYPFYGKVVLASGRDFESVLSPGSVIVARGLLDRLNLQVGDALHIGSATLTIKDVVLQEPDQPVNLFLLGPRIFIAADDLEALDLVKKGSRVEYRWLIKVLDEDKFRQITERLEIAADPDQERVETYRTARSRIKRFFDNLFFFLSLISIFTLLLAGIGIQSTLTAFLKDKEKTIAVMKTVGARSSFITRHYIFILSILGLAGTLIGLLSGLLLQYALEFLFKGLLPANVSLMISWRAVLEGICLGVLVVGLFSFIPLHRLKDIKPVTIFRKERIRSKAGWPVFLSAFLIFGFFLLLVFWQVKELKTALYFVLGVVLLIVITALLTGVVLLIFKRTRVRSLLIRQAIKGLFRPKNATRPIIITLTASLAVIFSIYIIEQNLDANFIRSYPEDAPNVFFLDIQPSQLVEFKKTIGIETEFYPIIRAKILSVNGEKINRKEERRRRGDNLARTFNLTYRNYLLDDEAIVKGRSLFREDWDELQVSVMDTVADIRRMKIGDRITFKIQGVPLQARISSIRSRTHESISPFFYFVFPENALTDAPQTIFTAVRVDKQQISPLQTKIVEKFPNVSVIDTTELLTVFTAVVKKLSLIIRFFAAFSMAAGILIILSSILATRYARIQEAVYYKILGARSNFVVNVFTLENLALGLVSATLALLISQVGSWLICLKVLHISYRPFILESIVLIIATVLLVVTVGLLPSISILRKKPVAFLREQTQE